MKTFYALFVCLLSGLTFLNAQSVAYDIGNYRARYERRPLLQLNTSLSFEGDYDNQKRAANRGGLGGSVLWQLNRNMDDRVLQWFFSGTAAGRWGNRGTRPTGEPTTYSNYRSRVSASRTIFHYQPAGRFWGWSGSTTAEVVARTKDAGNDWIKLSLSPTFFLGKGRLEYGQDALLANWMMNDLEETGVISNYKPEQVEALAKTITDIIGNRTFDFRRRRIYELKRLQQALFDAGLVEEESFDLFAILNDNWAFANRASLPYGKRILYGITADGDYQKHYTPIETFEHSFRTITSGVFIEYTHARIINNNGSSRWIYELEGNYLEDKNMFSSSENFFSSWQTGASITYRRIWLPISRMEFNWNTNATWEHYFPKEEMPSQVSIFESQSHARLSSSFNVVYFMNYQWNIELSMRANGYYQYGTEKNNIRFHPDISIRSFYSFF